MSAKELIKKYCSLKKEHVKVTREKIDDRSKQGNTRWSSLICLYKDAECTTLNCRYASIGLGHKDEIDPFS